LLRIRRPDRWYLAGAILIVLAIIVLSYQEWFAYQRSAPVVQHSRAVLQQIEQVLSYVKDAETGQRGFVLTGNPEYREVYDRAVSALPSELNNLRALVADEADLRIRVATLNSLISEKLSELKETVGLRQKQGFQAALDVVETNRGKRIMDDIRKVGDGLQNEIYTSLQQTIRQRQDQGSRTRLISVIGGGGAARVSAPCNFRYQPRYQRARSSDRGSPGRQ
jgi:CHASE3 domain sensor protein